MEVQITYQNKTKTLHMLRLLLTTYAQGFSYLFKYQRVKSITLDNVPPGTFDVFIGWLCMEYIRHKDTENKLWKGFGCLIYPDWFDNDDAGVDWYWGNFSSVLQYAKAVVNGYLFAEAYNVTLLRQDAIDRLI